MKKRIKKIGFSPVVCRYIAENYIIVSCLDRFFPEIKNKIYKDMSDISEESILLSDLNYVDNFVAINLYQWNIEPLKEKLSWLIQRHFSKGDNLLNHSDWILLYIRYTNDNYILLKYLFIKKLMKIKRPMLKIVLLPLFMLTPSITRKKIRKKLNI